MENYVYFRQASDGVNPGFKNCMEFPVLGVIFACREKGQKEEWSIVARQCGVVLPRVLLQKINYSIAKAEKQSEFGKDAPLRQLMPNTGEQGRQEALASAARDPGAEEARRDVNAQSSSGSYPSSAKASSSGDAQGSKKPRR